MKLINSLRKINIKYLLIVFIIIQPIFDLKIFYNSISTLIRVIFISLFFLYYFTKNKNKKKYYILLYFIIITIYYLLHNFNALSFYSLIPGNFNYSPIKEAIYFIKMVCPFLFIYCIYNATFSKNELLFIIKVIVLFISIIIIFSNLFLFSYGSYSDAIIKANFFEWFNLNSSYNYQDLASKGLFEFGNQISAILLMFLPFIIYSNLENKNKFDFIILCFNVFALILLCTKVAVFGIGLVFVYAILTVLFIRHSVRNMLKITVVFLIYVLLLPFNPSISRILERQQIVETASNTIYDIDINEAEELINNYATLEIENNISNLIDDNYKINYIENNYETQKINENFIINRYPYKYDPDFWYDILNNQDINKSDYRYQEQAMVKRVLEINNNKFDKWLGITYVRIQNIFNIEKDFIMQYYSLGILGITIFILPYFIILGFCIINILLGKFSKLSIPPLLSIITIFMMFAISYYSGNLLNSLSFTIYFSIPFLIVLKNKSKEN